MNPKFWLWLFLFTASAQAAPFGRLFAPSKTPDSTPSQPQPKTHAPAPVWRDFKGVLEVNSRPVKIWLQGGGKLIKNQNHAYIFDFTDLKLKPAQIFYGGKVYEYWQAPQP